MASKFDTRKEIGLKNSIFAVSFSPEGLLKVIFPFFTLYDILPKSNSSIRLNASVRDSPSATISKDFSLKIETSYNSELQGGNGGFGAIDTEFNVNITDYTENHIKGNFSGSLVYYTIEHINNVNYFTIDEEISFENKPIINGTFEIYTP